MAAGLPVQAGPQLVRSTRFAATGSTRHVYAHPVPRSQFNHLCGDHRHPDLVIVHGGVAPRAELASAETPRGSSFDSCPQGENGEGEEYRAG
jgi:hypothetical protein